MALNKSKASRFATDFVFVVCISLSVVMPLRTKCRNPLEAFIYKVVDR